MAAYIVASYEVTNSEGFAAYGPEVQKTLVGHDVEVLAADGQSETIEGRPDPFTVILRFPDKAAARAWYDSAAYTAIKGLRIDNSRGTMVLIDGTG